MNGTCGRNIPSEPDFMIPKRIYASEVENIINNIQKKINWFKEYPSPDSIRFVEELEEIKKELLEIIK